MTKMANFMFYVFCHNLKKRKQCQKKGRKEGRKRIMLKALQRNPFSNIQGIQITSLIKQFFTGLWNT